LGRKFLASFVRQDYGRLGEILFFSRHSASVKRHALFEECRVLLAAEVSYKGEAHMIFGVFAQRGDEVN